MTENGLSVRSVKVVTPFALLMRLSPADSKFEKMKIEEIDSNMYIGSDIDVKNTQFYSSTEPPFSHACTP